MTIDFERRASAILGDTLSGHHITLAQFEAHRLSVLTQALRQLAADVLEEAAKNFDAAAKGAHNLAEANFPKGTAGFLSVASGHEEAARKLRTRASEILK